MIYETFSDSKFDLELAPPLHPVFKHSSRFKNKQVIISNDVNLLETSITIQCFYSAENSIYDSTLFTLRNDPSNYLEVNVSTMGSLSIRSVVSGVATNLISFGVPKFVANHLCLVKNSTTWDVYSNGIKIVSFTKADINYTTVVVGGGYSSYFRGRIQEFVIINQALRSSNFTPEPYKSKAIVGNSYNAGVQTDRSYYVIPRENEDLNFSKIEKVFPYDYGWFLVHSDSEKKALLKQAESASENSEIFDHLVPRNYALFKTEFKPGDVIPLDWVETSEFTIDMGYTTDVDLKIISTSSTGFEMIKNNDVWTDVDLLVKDGDVVKFRIVLPANPYNTSVSGVFRIGPAFYEIKTFQQDVYISMSISADVLDVQRIAIAEPTISADVIDVQIIETPEPYIIADVLDIQQITRV